MLRKFFAALALVVGLAINPAQATDYIDLYYGQNPSSESTNLQGQYYKVAGGVQLLDMLGQSTAGFYTNLTLVPTGSSFNATVNVPSNQRGALYQLGTLNPLTLPAVCSIVPNCAGAQLPVDNTKVFVQGLQASASAALGPFTPSSTGGQAIAYLVEAQVSTVDQTSISTLLYNSNGVPQTQALPRDRSTVITYNVKASSSAISPTVPSVDTGYVGITSIVVPNGTGANLSGATITAFTPFPGFALNNAVVHINGNDTGSLQVSGTVTGSQLVSSISTGTAPLIVSSTTTVANLQAATAVDLATGSVLSIGKGGNGTATPQITWGNGITSSGSWGNYSVSVNGMITLGGPITLSNLTGNRCVRSNGSDAVVSSAADCVISVSAGDSNTVIGGSVTAPTVTSTQAPSYTSLTVTGLTPGQCVAATTGGLLISQSCTSLPANIMATSITLSADATAATIHDTGLTSGNCVYGSSGGLLVSAGAACITSASGTLPIVVSNFAGSITVSCPTCATGSINSVTGGPNITANTVAGAVTVKLSSPAPTAAPSSCAGWSSTFALTTETCATPIAGSNISVSGWTVSLASPAPTAVPSSCAAFSSTFVLQYTPCSSVSLPVAIANGGTNATSFAASNRCIRYDGTRLVAAAGDCLTSATTKTILTNSSSASCTSILSSASSLYSLQNADSTTQAAVITLYDEAGSPSCAAADQIYSGTLGASQLVQWASGLSLTNGLAYKLSASLISTANIVIGTK